MSIWRFFVIKNPKSENVAFRSSGRRTLLKGVKLKFLKGKVSYRGFSGKSWRTH